MPQPADRQRRVAFVGTRAAEEEVAERRRIIDIGNRTSRLKTARRIHGWFSDFQSANPRVKGDQAAQLFLCQLRLAEHAGGKRVRNDETIRDYGDVLRKFHMAEDDAQAVADRLDRTAFAAGLREVAKRHESSRENVVLPQEVVAWPAAGQVRRTFLKAATYLLMATGCRPHHLSQIRSLRFEPEGVMIRWLVRKVRGGGNNEWCYRYIWSFIPGQDVVDYLTQAWSDFVAEVAEPTRTAGLLDSYIRARCAERGYAQFTTRYYRCRMSTILHDEFVRGNLTLTQFGMMLDHVVGTSESLYMLPCAAESLLYRPRNDE